MSRAHEYRLVAQPHPLFVGIEDAVHNGAGLARHVVAPDQNRPTTTRPVSVQYQANPRLGGPDNVGQVQDGLHRPEVALERNDRHPLQTSRELMQVPTRRRPGNHRSPAHRRRRR